MKREIKYHTVDMGRMIGFWMKHYKVPVELLTWHYDCKKARVILEIIAEEEEKTNE